MFIAINIAIRISKFVLSWKKYHLRGIREVEKSLTKISFLN